MSIKSFDIIIIGAGVVGLAVAYELKTRDPAARIAIIEKESTPGFHASGRNSGVLHCGIYYGSDTLKAKVCSTGARRMMMFADEHDIAYRKSGKLILATDPIELPTIDRLLQNAAANKIVARKVTASEIHEIEPHAAPGPAAIFCQDTAVIDSVAVVKKLAALLIDKGVEFIYGSHVLGRAGESALRTSTGNYAYGYLYNCTGAYADVIARHFDAAQGYALVPFKGIYWKLKPEVSSLVRANIYPVPDVSMPFLGVHLTKVINGDVYIGPTAIPVFGRENYHKLQGVHWREFIQIGTQLAQMYIGNQNNFRRLAHMEIAKYSKAKFLVAARRLMPCLDEKLMLPTPKSGIRPQLINLKTKQLEMDYILERKGNSLHVLNAISPAFTSSFSFAEMIVDSAQ